jgi:uncharacterized protein (DUF433 family)
MNVATNEANSESVFNTGSYLSLRSAIRDVIRLRKNFIIILLIFCYNLTLYLETHYFLLDGLKKEGKIMYDRIIINPSICHGKPVVKGTRVLVSNILGALATNETCEDIIEDYPNIIKEDILAALAFESYSYNVKVS